jgi:DNA-binding NtrC family response regulator
VDGFLAGQAVRKRLGEGSLEKLMAYDWPANVRELRSVLLRAAANVDGKEISPEAITFDLAPAGAPARPRGLGNLPAYLNAIERDWLERALVEADGVAKDAAKQVGMDYHAFRRALVRHGLPTA